jgi:outer membrane protein OmpA-like peptidoglycan-associated protein
MIRRRVVLAIVVVLCSAAAAALFAGCAGTEIDSRTEAARDVIKRARENGAYKCAPHELAMAESHADFAENELHEGDYYRARQELDVAEQNANEALRKSPKDKCAPGVAIAQGCKDTDGDGICDDVDACPTEPEDKDGFQDADGCPDPDNDQDGIPDVRDKCPNDPEDKDGFQDEDGCPDPDNDGDKVLDVNDKCPNEYAETPDGCPKKYQLVVVTKEKIEIKQTVYFDFNKATIKPVSFALLNEVALALKDNPTIHVRVEGHTDSRGNDAYNLKLSQKRAESVRTYIMGQGVSGDRMEPKGFGRTMPIADNRTEAGRSQNRRVEFIITSQ